MKENKQGLAIGSVWELHPPPIVFVWSQVSKEALKLVRCPNTESHSTGLHFSFCLATASLVTMVLKKLILVPMFAFMTFTAPLTHKITIIISTCCPCLTCYFPFPTHLQRWEIGKNYKRVSRHTIGNAHGKECGGISSSEHAIEIVQCILHSVPAYSRSPIFPHGVEDE